MANTDLSRLLKADEIKQVLRKPQKKVVRRVRRLNPLKNTKALLRLNPYAAVLKRKAVLTAEKRKLAREELLAKKRNITLPNSHPVVRSAKLQKRRREQILNAKKNKPKKVAGAKKPAPAKKVAPAKKPAPAKK